MLLLQKPVKAGDSFTLVELLIVIGIRNPSNL